VLLGVPVRQTLRFVGTRIRFEPDYFNSPVISDEQPLQRLPELATDSQQDFCANFLLSALHC